jgi:hypothetical protein
MAGMASVVRGKFSAIRSSAIPPLPAAVREYTALHGLMAVVQWRDSRFGIARDPTGASTAWWCSGICAGQILRKVEAAGVTIEEAALQLGVELIDHSRLLIRARARALGQAVANARASRGMRW